MNTNQQNKSSLKKHEIRESLEGLINLIAEAKDDEHFKKWLAVQARFHNYSWGNTMLIMLQKPDATKVAGFCTWKKQKRRVRKGERGILIWVPCLNKKKTERLDNEDEPVITQSLSGFRIGYVWDVSQTEGDELPELKYTEQPTITRRSTRL